MYDSQSFSRLSRALSTMSHKGLLCPRRLASESLGATLHLDFVSISHGSSDGILCIKLNMGEFGSERADSATENANILSGVGSGEEGV